MSHDIDDIQLTDMCFFSHGIYYQLADSRTLHEQDKIGSAEHDPDIIGSRYCEQRVIRLDTCGHSDGRPATNG